MPYWTKCEPKYSKEKYYERISPSILKTETCITVSFDRVYNICVPEGKIWYLRFLNTGVLETDNGRKKTENFKQGECLKISGMRAKIIPPHVGKQLKLEIAVE